MSMYDRDWYRDGYKEKEKKYGGDFSLNGNSNERKNTINKPLINPQKNRMGGSLKGKTNNEKATSSFIAILCVIELSKIAKRFLGAFPSYGAVIMVVMLAIDIGYFVQQRNIFMCSKGLEKFASGFSLCVSTLSIVYMFAVLLM